MPPPITKADARSSPQIQRCLRDFAPRELLLEDLTIEDVQRILAGTLPDLDSRFVETIVRRLACQEVSTIDDVPLEESVLADFSVSFFTESRLAAEGIAATSGVRFGVDSQATNLRVGITVSPEEGLASMRLLWDEELCEFLALDEGRWELVTFALLAWDSAFDASLFYSPSDGRAGARPIALGNGKAVLRIGQESAKSEEMLADSLLVLRPELQPFVLPGRFEETESRIYHLKARIVGSASADGPRAYVENVAGIRQGVAMIADVLADDDQIPLGWLVYSDIVVPVTRAIDAERALSLIRVLEQRKARDEANRETKNTQSADQCCIRAPDASTIVTVLHSFGYVQGSSEDMYTLAQSIREYLVGTGRIDQAALEKCAPIGARTEWGETAIVASGIEAELCRYVEFLPMGGGDRPIVRISAEPPPADFDDDPSLDESFDDDETDDTETDDTELWREDEEGGDQAEEEYGEESSPLEVRQPSEVYLRLEWPRHVSPRPDTATLQVRWEKLDNILRALGRDAVPEDLSLLPIEEDDWSIRALDEAVSIQISRTVRIGLPELP